MTEVITECNSEWPNVDQSCQKSAPVAMTLIFNLGPLRCTGNYSLGP